MTRGPTRSCPVRDLVLLEACRRQYPLRVGVHLGDDLVDGQGDPPPTHLPSERHSLVHDGKERAHDYVFVMRCWTREELAESLASNGFRQVAYFGALYHLGELLRAGQWPLLDPSAWNGGNFAVEGQWGLLSPLSLVISVAASYTADAVARFALGRPVLPIDTNVRRVLDRTRAEFDPDSAAALMDLGTTVCLARVPRCDACPLATRCPSRGQRFRPARKQGPFQGSFRQRRAATLRALAERPQRLDQVDTEAAAALVRDGLATVDRGRVTLPERPPVGRQPESLRSRTPR